MNNLNENVERKTERARVQFRTAVEGERAIQIVLTDHGVDHFVINIDGWVTERGVDIPFIYRSRAADDWLEEYEVRFLAPDSFQREDSLFLILRSGEATPSEAELLAHAERWVKSTAKTVETRWIERRPEDGPQFAYEHQAA
jgi:hypothetical protein